MLGKKLRQHTTAIGLICALGIMRNTSPLSPLDQMVVSAAIGGATGYGAAKVEERYAGKNGTKKITLFSVWFLESIWRDIANDFVLWGCVPPSQSSLAWLASWTTYLIARTRQKRALKQTNILDKNHLTMAH